MHQYQKIETASDHDDESQVSIVHERTPRLQVWITRVLSLMVIFLTFALVWGWRRYEELQSSIIGESKDLNEIYGAQRSPYSMNPSSNIQRQ